VQRLSVGIINEAPCCPAELFRAALLAGAAAVVIVHNHPSGNPEASARDLQLLQELCELGQKLRLLVTDFVIIGDEDYWSASDRNLIVNGRYLPWNNPTLEPIRRGRPRKELPKAAGQ